MSSTETTSVPRGSSDLEAATAPPEQPSVLAIVVTHDGRRWLRDSLVALANQSYEHIDILVVDDASTRPREEPRLKRIVKRHLRRRRWGYLRTPRPLGYGAAINWALSRVRTDADYLLFVHDDAALTLNSVAKMVERLRDEDRTAIVGPKIVSWDDPSVLEEVGMAIDRFGYPYKGLEQGEIDLGQHDRATEVFYVTSTVMLVRHDVFKQMRGFDSHLGAYSEDLDLCWRARLLGYNVRLEPGAVARHVIAMATAQRSTRFGPPRYFIRRNRLHTITKNASGLRLLTLIPLFLLLTLGEMLGFLVLREPREVGNLGRALMWNLVRFPQTLGERRRVQSNRKVSDKDLSRLMVRLPSRLRVYALDQAERLEESWGRRADIVSRRTTQARAATARVKGWQIAGVIAMFVLVVLGFRDFFWAPVATFGEILPFPDGATSMWRQWASPWQDAGLGSPGPAPTSFLILGVVQFLSFGAVGFAQKLLILLLGVTAFLGATRLVSELVDRFARLVTGVVYVLGAIGYAGLRDGALGALVFGAAAPFVLLSILRLVGWIRPAMWSAGREVATLGLFAALSAAFVPGSLFLYLAAALLLAALRTFVGRGGTELKAVGGSVIGLALGWALLLPWSLSWMTDGGALSVLGAGPPFADFASHFNGHGMMSVLLGQTPEGPVLFGLALPILGIVAVATGAGQRRRMAIALWALIVGMGFLVTATASGILPPIVASPTEMGVLISLAFSGLAGIAVAAFRLDLPRRGFGIVQGLTVAGLAAALFLVAAGLAPTFVRGDWAPGSADSESSDASEIDQITALLRADAATEGEFRALWIGRDWTGDAATSARPAMSAFLTDSYGPELNDLFAGNSGEGKRRLNEIVDSIEAGETDRAGNLLGSFNIRFVIVDLDSRTRPWETQRDLALVRGEADFFVFQDEAALARAAVYEELPPYVTAIEEEDPALASGERPVERAVFARESSWKYRAAPTSGPGVIFLTDTNDENWKATSGDDDLDRTQSGWGNAFELPAGDETPLELEFPRSLMDYGWLVALPLLWLFMIGAAFPSRRGEKRRAQA
ncbi:MAG TPA: glycosyltransferase [Actinomycetota bacterium]|nr:glycosyltransferase [Actinomycetota bacterium]